MESTRSQGRKGSELEKDNRAGALTVMNKSRQQRLRWIKCLAFEKVRQGMVATLCS